MCTDSEKIAAVASEHPAPQDNRHTLTLTWIDFEGLCANIVAQIGWRSNPPVEIDDVYGIPVGGWFAAKEIARMMNKPLARKVGKNTLVVDDIVDTGRTLAPYVDIFPTATLVVKQHAVLPWPDFHAREVDTGVWVQFPWEAKREINDSVRRVLEYIGENPNREGLKETPERVVRSWEELYGGYKKDPKTILHAGVQFTEHKNYDQVIAVKNIEFFSMCEHHMLPFFGKIHIGYLPKFHVAGVSKLARMVECFSRRLQIQERMTQDIAGAIQEIMDPKGVGVVCEAKHLCMVMRGVQKQNSEMVTSSMTGVFREESVKQEFFRLIGR